MEETSKNCSPRELIRSYIFTDKVLLPRTPNKLFVCENLVLHLQKVHVEFSHQELLEFYNKLEMIQAQLDSLT
ncbi:hypothetical protein QTP86_015026 [Hemibagrus guttatus]|nr:hypothetical protein QTP86_015026 [Hemibagrus guttatus]